MSNKGKFVFEGIQEGEGETLRQLFFTPPLQISFDIREKIDATTGKENFPEDTKLMGFVTFDFGMQSNFSLDVDQNILVNGYEGLSPESDPIDILRNTLMFDLFHSFFESIEDPNFSHYNWAIQGWLQERTSVKMAD